MKRKWAAPLLLAVMAAVALVAWRWSGSTKQAAPVSQEGAAPPAVRVATDVLRFPDGAPQLSMIRAQALAVSPVPLGDALSARVAYDEDATARVGVSISGRVVAIQAAPGDIVKAGQVLAEIDSPDFGTAQADLNKAQADAERKRLAV